MSARRWTWSGATLLAVLLIRALGGTSSPAVPPEEGDDGNGLPPVSVLIHGRLSAEALGELKGVRPDPGGSLVAFVRREEVYTCEDLGRQLRELARRLGGGSRLVVWTEPGSAGRVAAYLKQEKVRHDLLVSPRLNGLFERGSLPATPSAVVVSAEGEMRGVAHTRYAANIRALSFADEMAPLVREGSEME